MYSFVTQGTCARKITFDIKDGRLSGVSFSGGCPGNLAAISKLVEGMEALKVAELLAGNQCGGRGTSCADQLSRAIYAAAKDT